VDRRNKLIGIAMHHRLAFAAVLLATVTGAAQTSKDVDALSSGAVLKNSEIQYVESGGLAGRTTEAHFMAADGRVTAGYRGPDLRAPEGMQMGTVDNDAYLALWRDADRLKVWTIQSPPKATGADLIEYELRIRQGSRSHVIRWNDANVSSGRIEEVAAWARRILAVAREYAAFK
jgi:hypothetical protein